MLSSEAHAKVNLSLEIVGKRADGYHDLVSVMQTVSLADRLEFVPRPSRPDDELRCSDLSLEGPDNLVWKAAQALRALRPEALGYSIHLEKRLPAAAGLGGGSSDAATTLRNLSHLWAIPMSCGEMNDIAAALGSDVPFFLYGGTTLVTGRGEHVERLPDSQPMWFLLVKPNISVSTAEIFRHLSPADWTDGVTTRDLAREICRDRLLASGINGLQNTLFSLYPAARECFERVAALAPRNTAVSGSGPTVFAMFKSEEEAHTVRDRLQHYPYWMEIARSCFDRPPFSACV